MRVIAALFFLMFFVVGVGFYFQATHDYRQRGQYEPPAKGMFREGDAVHLGVPVHVCQTAEDCREARDMHRRMTLDEPTAGDIRIGKEWFEFRKDAIRAATDMVILESGPHYTRVRIASGPNADFEGYVFTLALEEAATESRHDD